MTKNKKKQHASAYIFYLKGSNWLDQKNMLVYWPHNRLHDFFPIFFYFLYTGY